MDISIIICSYNNCARLRETLCSIENCDTPKGISIELILVNNASQDDTHELKNHKSNKFNYKYIEEPNKGKSNALNTGIGHSQGKLIIFTDDDVKPNAKWITAYWDGYKKHGEDFILGGNVTSIFENDDFNKHLLKHAPYSVSGLNFGSEKRVLGEREFFIGANYAIPRQALRLSNGFKTNIGLNPDSVMPSIGEETEIQKSLQGNGILRAHLPDAEIWHFVPRNKTTLRHTLKRRLAYGIFKATFEMAHERNGRIKTALRLSKQLAMSALQIIIQAKDQEKAMKHAHDMALILGQIAGSLNGGKHSTEN